MGNCSTREDKGSGGKGGSSSSSSNIKNNHGSQQKDAFGGKSGEQSLGFKPPTVLKVSEIVRPDNYRIKSNKA